jgi:Pyridoxamine 5'-phosphate oxidase
MKMGTKEAWRRLEVSTHGVLCTVHPLRGIDVVPCVYAIDDAGFVGVPIDTVKDKSTARLQREVNLDADPRASLLVESWDPVDWSRLWWVRVELRHVTTPDPARIKTIEDLLAHRIEQYEDRPFSRLLVLEVLDLSGWAASSNS